MSEAKAFRCEHAVFPDGEQAATIIVEGESISEICAYDKNVECPIIEIDGYLLPALVDSHVHINEPGRTDWEGFDTATHAAAAGGIATLVDMPLNCIPVTTTAAALNKKLKTVAGKLWVDCAYWGGATADNLMELPELLRAGVVGAKSFTIHSGIDEFQEVNRSQLKAAMRELALFNLPHLVHAEVELPMGQSPSIGLSYQRFLESRPKSWENEAIQMVIEVMRELKAEGLIPRAHIVHLSSAEALPMLAAAKSEGFAITVETCPHYLTLSSETIPDGGTLYKCCPPIREQENQLKLWQALKSGLIDFIVSDHSPCTPQLKALDTGDIGDAWGGISALQFGLSLIWSAGQRQGLDLVDIVKLMSQKPAEVAGLGNRKGKLTVGYDADFCVFAPGKSFEVTSACIKHKHKVNPYIGQTLSGVVEQTWLRGGLIFDRDQYIGSARGRSILKANVNTQ